MGREQPEILEAPVEDICERGLVETEVAMHEGVAKPSDAAEAAGKRVRQDAKLGKLVEGLRVVGSRPTAARHEVRCEIQDILTGELQAPFDHPRGVLIRLELRSGRAPMSTQVLNHLVQSREVPLNDSHVDTPRAHRPNSPSRMRSRSTASMRASCGLQSQ